MNTNIDDYETTQVRIYRKDHRKLRRLQLQASERKGRSVTIAELFGDGLKLLEQQEQQLAERELAQ